MRAIKIAIKTVFFAALLGVGFYAKELFLPAPCSEPIRYHIGSLDQRFGISEAELMTDLERASSIWEIPSGKHLFAYSKSGKYKSDKSEPDKSLAINLIFDYRQKATNDMDKIGVDIKDDLATYDAVKEKYNLYKLQYEAEKAKVDEMYANYKSDKSNYDRKVSDVNARGGASPSEYSALEEERAKVNMEASMVNEKNSKLNELADTLNSMVSVLNRLAKELNISVTKYNSIGESTGLEFDEGEYVKDSTGERINVYQFESDEKLVRVLSHELGHALGLDHINDPKAIMYRLNQGSVDKATVADLAELARVCGKK